jgi:hypothetical protein
MRHSRAESFKEIKDGRLELFICFAVDHGNALVTHGPLEVVRTPWTLHWMLEVCYDNWLTASQRALEKRIIEVFHRYLYRCSADQVPGVALARRVDKRTTMRNPYAPAIGVCAPVKRTLL